MVIIIIMMVLNIFNLIVFHIREGNTITGFVNKFGQIDDQTINKEIDLNWTGDEYQFQPLDVDLDEETQEFIFYLCKGYNIDFCLVMAIIKQESNFDASTISPTNDYGLMQINIVNHEWLTDTLGVTDFLDPEENVRAGVFVLRKLFEEYNDPSLVLMSYNMGEKGATKLWKKGIYSTEYTESVFEYQAMFEKELQRKGEDVHD